MNEAFLLGIVAGSSLLIGALVAYRVKVKQRYLGLLMGFGVGALISAVAYELVEEAFRAAGDNVIIGLGLMVGAVTFFLLDVFIESRGAKDRKRAEGSHPPGKGGVVLLATVIDNIPEAMLVGLSILKNGGGMTFLVLAVFLANLPEAIASTTRLKASGWRPRGIFSFWALVVLVCGLASLFAYIFFDQAPVYYHALVLAIAGGAILTMLADTMIPEAYRDSGKWVGLVITFGFAVAYILNSL